jgi:DNA-binding CsgD family transcriptional regulator
MVPRQRPAPWAPPEGDAFPQACASPRRPVPRVQLLWTAALLLLEAIASDAPCDSELVVEIGDLLGEAGRPAPPPAEPAWPGQPLTQSETRVLRYLPTHLGAPEIAAELYLSANTVKTHLRHLYRKLGAHSRHEAVQRARAIGLLTASSRRPETVDRVIPRGVRLGVHERRRTMAYGHAERNLALLRQLEAETRHLLDRLDQPDPEQSAWLQEVTGRVDDR